MRSRDFKAAKLGRYRTVMEKRDAEAFLDLLPAFRIWPGAMLRVANGAERVALGMCEPGPPYITLKLRTDRSQAEAQAGHAPTGLILNTYA